MKNRLSIYFTLPIFLISLALKAKELPFNLSTSTGVIHGTLSLPNGNKPKPIVLLISGSGPTDRDGNQPNLMNNSLKLIAEGLEKQGIASIRFDKRGVASSVIENLKEEDLRFDNYVDDVKSWINLLSEDKRFSKIFVAGHSEGALIGLIATNASNKVAGYISIAGSGRVLDELLLEQLKNQPEELKDQVISLCNQLKDGRLVENPPKELYQLFRPSVQPYLISWLKFSPTKEIAKISVPTLIIQGTTDIQVAILDAELLSKAQPIAKKILIQDMNHVLKLCPSLDRLIQMEVAYSNPKTPLHKELLPAIIIFIRAN